MEVKNNKELIMTIDSSSKLTSNVNEPDILIEKRQKLEALLRSRFFYTPAYEIYGGVKGLYDYGPPGSAFNTNLINLWRRWFILEENMQQITTSSLAPEIVFQASGHCAKFEDKMVRDEVTDECHRADHLLEDIIDVILKNSQLTHVEIQTLNQTRAEADSFTCEELDYYLNLYNATSPIGNRVTKTFPFNLMFSTQIGPTGKYKGYLRPETAQGIFVNFDRLLEYNGGKLPFAAAQIGTVYRNEIAPRSSLLRVREFTLAEIEHFVDPSNKNHEKFHTIKNILLPLYTRASQCGDQVIIYMTGENAVESGIINNQTLCYFIARTYLFMIRIGACVDKIRFRQHLENEMAHYAVGCWDAELKTTYGWIECVGIADRGTYDLSVHQKASHKNLSVFVPFPDGCRNIEYLVAEPNKSTLGKKYKTDVKNLFAALEAIKDDQDQLRELKKQLEIGSVELAGIQISSEDIKFKTVKKEVMGRSITPGVIEPSFGIGRIIYSILEHSFYVRPDTCDTKLANIGKRMVLSLKPIIAPVCCSILPLINTSDLLYHVRIIDSLLKENNITTKMDTTSVSIGRRYARADELGIPFNITVDNISTHLVTRGEQTVTLRERDSTEQVRISIAELPHIILNLLHEVSTWDQIKLAYPIIMRSKGV